MVIVLRCWNSFINAAINYSECLLNDVWIGSYAGVGQDPRGQGFHDPGWKSFPVLVGFLLVS